MNRETLLASPVLKASITCLASLVLFSSVASSAPSPDALSTIDVVGNNIATINRTSPKNVEVINTLVKL
jgi:hypothetical protein